MGLTFWLQEQTVPQGRYEGNLSNQHLCSQMGISVFMQENKGGGFLKSELVHSMELKVFVFRAANTLAC